MMYIDSNSSPSYETSSSITGSSSPPFSPPPLSIRSEEDGWRQLIENHHELCAIERCNGTRINGLFICQFSNVQGHVYNQYLLYKCRNEAYKNKQCRNFHANGFCLNGSSCPYVHDAKENSNKNNNGGCPYEVCAIFQYSGGYCPYLNHCRYLHWLNPMVTRQQQQHRENNTMAPPPVPLAACTWQQQQPFQRQTFKQPLNRQSTSTTPWQQPPKTRDMASMSPWHQDVAAMDYIATFFGR